MGRDSVRLKIFFVIERFTHGTVAADNLLPFRSSPPFEQALALTPDSVHQLRVLDAWGECAEALGQYREAVHAIEQALTLGGSEVTRHLSAARLLRGGSHR